MKTSLLFNTETTYPRSILPITLLGLASILLWYTRDTAHWRDSAEFILAGTYLDIPHPPGFPTYGAFANLFSLLPFGPLTWRIHLFSIIVTLICCVLTVQISLLITERFTLSNTKRVIISLIPLLPLFLSPAFIRQATTAEAYQLNALFLLSILWCGIAFESKKDCRYLYLAGLLSGMGIGNHPSLLLFALPGFFCFLSELNIKRITLAFLFTLSGMLLFSYLPIRALTHPPLNTGSPHTIERFWNLITDARDRHLRPIAITTIGHVDEFEVGEQIRISQDDAQKILDETGWFLAPLGVLAIPLLFFILPVRTATLFVISLGSILFFFRGWQPDPFVPVFFVLASLCSLTLCILASRSSQLMQIGYALILVALTIPQSFHNTPELIAQQQHTLPYRAGSTLLKSLPYHSVLLTESTWYLATYLQEVEGVRTDLSISYIPSYLFSHYFNPTKSIIGETTFQAKSAPEISAPNFSSLGSFLSQAIHYTSVFLEPSESANTILLQGASMTKDGLLRIGKPIPVTLFPRQLTQLGKEIRKLPPSYLRRDAASYLETRALPVANFIRLQSQKSFLAINGLRAICGSSKEIVCSDAIYLKTVQYALMSGDIKQARFLLQELVRARGITPLSKKLSKAIEENNGASSAN